MDTSGWKGLVLKRIPTNSSKLSALYSNPMKIVKHDHPTYWVQDPNDDKIIQVHVSQLRTCNSNYIH
ncbi:unnamed protein product [Rotaria sp. Silwood1]|nr:unnamed protein product [Rotaria sp. Silwood1]CAF5053342.1 unnamed protein product [Rotaria sp. Silwood1]